MRFQKHFFILYAYLICTTCSIRAPIEEWEEIKPQEIVSKKTPAYKILMQEEAQKQSTSLNKLRTWLSGKSIANDPESGFTTFSEAQENLKAHKEFSPEWDLAATPLDPAKEKKLHDQALQTIQNTTQYYQDIANGTRTPDASDEKIFNDFFLRPELFKAFITNPSIHIFPEALRARIQTILKNPDHVNELEKLGSAMLAAKKKFIDEQQQQKQIKRESHARDTLNLEHHFKETLEEIKKQQFKEQQQMQEMHESSKRSDQEAEQQKTHTNLKQEFDKLLQDLRQKQHIKDSSKHLTTIELKHREQDEQEQQREYEQLLEEYKKKQEELKKSSSNPKTLIQTTTTTDRAEIKKQAHEQYKKQFQEQLLRSKPERERLKKEKYLDELGQAKDIKPSVFKHLMSTSLIINDNIRQEVVKKYVDKFCEPFQVALDNPTLPQDQRAMNFLKNIPTIALHNGATLRQYLMLNHINTPFDIADTTPTEQNAIFDGLAIKIKQYKRNMKQ